LWSFSLAYAEMRLILAKMVFNFDMELVDKDMDWLDHKSTTLWIKPPLNVYLTLRGV
jgi:cytochrome P450